MNQEHASASRPKSGFGLHAARRAQLIRVLYAEIGRLLSHILNVPQALEVGALPPPAVGFEKEKLMGVLRARIGPARMHANYFRVGRRATATPAAPSSSLRQSHGVLRPVACGSATISKTAYRQPTSSSSAMSRNRVVEKKKKKKIARRRWACGIFRGR